MTHEDLELEAHKLNKTLQRIDKMAMEMNNDQNDGWVKEHYRNTLKNIRDHINKVLEK
jgi:flagellin-like hook-associated protein FlgL